MLEHWSWVDWYILEHKEHPLVTLRRWALGRGLRRPPTAYPKARSSSTRDLLLSLATWKRP